MKLILGGLAGGVVKFVWGATSHMALPLGEAGLRSMPADKEPAVLEAMGGAMSERAIYFFPGMDTSRTPAAEEQEAWEARLEAGPTGIVVFTPQGGEALSPRQLLTELGATLAGLVMARLVQPPAAA